MTIAQPAPASHVQGGVPPVSHFRMARAFLFPVLTNVWPILLFVSQKAFVVPGILLVGFGDSAYRRDIVIALALTLVGFIVYITQYSNVYDQAHFLGFVFFAWSIPIINHASRIDNIKLREILTYITVVNAVIGFFLMISDIDLTGLRGLNKIVGSDGGTHRVYFESASLASVSLFSTFKKKWIKFAAAVIIISFIIFVARSVAIIILLFANISLPFFLKRSPAIKITVLISMIVLLYLSYIYLQILRPDVELSLRAKEFQFNLIINFLGSEWSGWGWGAFYPAMASDPDQPYQVEMQLPMLMLQLGIVAFIVIMSLTALSFIGAASDNKMFGFARFFVYSMIGFNNPWLFIPSWFLTCQMLFRYDDERS
ncbi:hypothetical protein SAMN06295912_1416 [Sphingomonas laterariae]|uniref:Uncharacterized protein n=1 Tax=Edaphosphingomonas laterariae TaxID=861865 RepID=A0A239JWL1_9SPHN|nr:hypothetical protein [Sphingomonas laterariae]SNT10195.1 hypothetical protein SAMN06295912_1416 [Sphingomonas laterariae]